MIALEWNVGALRQRGMPFDDLAADDQLAVLTHYYKRTQAPTHDGTTLEAATALDLVHVQRTLTRRKPAADSGGDGMKAAIALVTEKRDAAAKVPRGD